ncbi:MAG: hypothetical protein AAGH40_14840 [Verrucomicrobiota bacterium]
MLNSRSVGLILISLTLVACGVSSSSDQFKGEAVIGLHKVIWNTVLKTDDPVTQTPLLFEFASTVRSEHGVTEANWEAEAKLQDLPVEVVKLQFEAKDIYPSEMGGVALCTVMAIREGFCEEIEILTLKQKVSKARQALFTNEPCNWIGFDPTFDTLNSDRAGAKEFTLWVKADCS